MKYHILGLFILGVLVSGLGASKGRMNGSLRSERSAEEETAAEPAAAAETKPAEEAKPEEEHKSFFQKLGSWKDSFFAGVSNLASKVSPFASKAKESVTAAAGAAADKIKSLKGDAEAKPEEPKEAEPSAA